MGSRLPTLSYRIFIHQSITRSKETSQRGWNGRKGQGHELWSQRSDGRGDPGHRGLHTEWLLASATELPSVRGAKPSVLQTAEGKFVYMPKNEIVEVIKFMIL